MTQSSRSGGGLTPDEVSRYSRHLTLPEVGVEGQLRLRAASVAIVGAGGLGSPVALYLAAAGVGRIGLVDFDRIELSNLQRQVLYGTRDVGHSKIEQARERLRDLNPCVRIDAHDLRLTADNALEILEEYDLIVDGTDNFPTRFLVNDACVLLGKPNVYGSVFRFEGQASVFWAAHGPCYRCLYREPPARGSVPNCAEGGVLGVLPGIIGMVQATEAIKWILGRGDSLVGRLLLFDGLEMSFREVRLRKDPECPVCGEQPTIHELTDEAEACDSRAIDRPADLAPRMLQERLGAQDAPLLLDVRTRQEWEICHLEGAILIPLAELSTRLAELDRDKEIVVYCHSGQRSAMATEFLSQQGFKRVQNLVGGIDAWSLSVDPSVPRY